MENTGKDIQVEGVQPPEGLNTSKLSIPRESPAKKTSVFCFKKRKKPCEKVAEDGESDSLLQKAKKQMPKAEPGEGEVSDPSWSSGGAWLSFKRIITLRKRRNKSSLKRQTQSSSQVQLESNGEDPGVTQFPKERGTSGLKMPCLRFSRSKKASCSDVAEELECGEKADQVEDILDNKSHCEPERVALEDLASVDRSPDKASEGKQSESELEENSKDLVISGREDMFAVEMKPDPDQYMDPAVQSEIIHSETVLETEQEKQIFQLHHGSLYGNPTEAGNERFDFQVEIGPLIPLDLSDRELAGSEAEEAEKIQAQGDELGQPRRNVDVEVGGSGTEEGNTVKVMLHCSPAPSVLNGAEEEVEAKPEETKPAMPGAGIVIMITEVEDYHEEEEPEPPCDSFSFPQANKPKGKKRSSKGTDSGAGVLGSTREGKTCSKGPTPISPGSQEHRTSEQYERLLMETAASLVKAAIQSSIEQLINEMALELNKQNSFL